MTEVSFSQFYNRLVKRKGDLEAAMFLFGSDNQAMRAEKALYDLSAWARERPALADYLLHAPAETIWADLQAGAMVEGLDEFKGRFGDTLVYRKPVP